MIRFRFVLWFLCCAGILSVLRCADPERTPQVSGDVILIVIDTLRADHTSVHGYARKTTPQLERWFQDGALYSHAYAAEASTSPSVISILTGQLPPAHGIRLLYQKLSDDVTLLPSLLPKSFQTAAFVSNIVLTDEAIGMANRFEHFDDFVDERESARLIFERNARRTTDAALAWLATERDPERRLFLMVHYIDPHGPYDAPPEWQRSFAHERPTPIDVNRIAAYQRLPNTRDGLDYVDQYDEEIAFVDSQVGRLLDAYAQSHAIEDALVIVTSDHGESMIEHEWWFTHGYHVYEEIVRVPLMLRGPGVKPGTNANLVSGIDIAPTILQAIGAEVPAYMAQVDLRTGAGLTEQRIVYTEGRGDSLHRRAAVQGRDKWLLSIQEQTEALLYPVYYDLAHDPQEVSPQPWQLRQAATRTFLDFCAADPDRAGIPRSYPQGISLPGPKVAPGVSDATQEKLRALGYIE